MAHMFQSTLDCWSTLGLGQLYNSFEVVYVLFLSFLAVFSFTVTCEGGVRGGGGGKGVEERGWRKGREERREGGGRKKGRGKVGGREGEGRGGLVTAIIKINCIL